MENPLVTGVNFQNTELTLYGLKSVVTGLAMGIAITPKTLYHYMSVEAFNYKK